MNKSINLQDTFLNLARKERNVVTIYLVNGKIEFAYTYTMSNRYKEMLTRAPYYAPRMQPYSY